MHTENEKVADGWLMEHNETCRAYTIQHRSVRHNADIAVSWRATLTDELLMNMLVVEVAARPWLYPRAADGDTDSKARLVALDLLTEKQTPSLNVGFMRKLLSRCASYEEDFIICCILHDS